MSVNAWRGPGIGRPDLPLPPGRMPVLRGGRMRKRWRYVGVYGPELMLCAAAVQIGPLRQSFWSLWDREGRHEHGRTQLRPGGDVALDGSCLTVKGDGVEAVLTLGEGEPIESICPSGERGYGWTRKRAGLAVTGSVRTPERSFEIEARGIDDESAGYHQRHTSWSWSAGIGRAADGRAVAWNLVEGINDPPHESERAIWLDGEPHEPAPVAFSGLDGVEFADGAKLAFAGESERERDDNLIVFRSRYRHRFGTFAGSLEGVELSEGFGVMERHKALW
jgi:hypothetical protein